MPLPFLDAVRVTVPFVCALWFELALWKDSVAVAFAETTLKCSTELRAADAGREAASPTAPATARKRPLTTFDCTGTGLVPNVKVLFRLR